MNNKGIICVLSLAEFPFRKLILISLSFHFYHCFHNSLVDCTKEAAVHQHGEKISRQLFFNIASWSYFFCHGSVNTAKQGGARWLPHLLPFYGRRLKHDNGSKGHAFLYVRTARILMHIYESCCIYTNLDVYIRIFMYISPSCM